jgi:hypothetical protein
MSDGSDYVVATYREIAAHFQLGDPRAARTKAKRAGWIHEPVNHPADPRRVRVPRSSWERAGVSPRARRRFESWNPGVHPSSEHRGSSAQIMNEHRGSPITDHRGSAPETEDEPQGPKIPQEPEPQGSKRRTPRDLYALIAPLQEQLERERGRADAFETEVRELTEHIAVLREQLAAANAHVEASAAQARDATAKLGNAQENGGRLREERAAALAKAEAAENQIDDLKAEVRKEGEGRAEAQARAELLQVEIERLRAEARSDGPVERPRHRWRFWRRRG